MRLTYHAFSFFFLKKTRCLFNELGKLEIAEAAELVVINRRAAAPFLTIPLFQLIEKFRCKRRQHK
jgi:hypothetical protein